MNRLRKWLHKPKRSDPQLLAQFYYADEELSHAAADLSLSARRDPQHCALLVGHFRSCQDNVLSILEQIMNVCIHGDRANRDFCAKFPEEVRQSNLAGQLWIGAECLAAGSIIMNQEVQSVAIRPIAMALIRSMEGVRTAARAQALRDVGVYSDRLRKALRQFDSEFAEFELRYVSAMVPVKSAREHSMQQEVTVLFCDTVLRALKHGYFTQDMIDDYEPVLMFTIPRLAIVCGLVVFSEGPINPDRQPEDMSELFRPFHSLLEKIRDLLMTLKEDELAALERSLCVPQGKKWQRMGPMAELEDPEEWQRMGPTAEMDCPEEWQRMGPTAELEDREEWQRMGPTAELEDPEEWQRMGPTAELDRPEEWQRMGPTAELDRPEEWQRMGPTAELERPEEWQRMGPTAELEDPEESPETELSCSMQYDLEELEQLSAMFHREGDEMFSLLSPPSQDPATAPLRRCATGPSAEVTCGMIRSGETAGDKEDEEEDEEEDEGRFFPMDDLEELGLPHSALCVGRSAPPSLLLPLRSSLSVPPSPLLPLRSSLSTPPSLLFPLRSSISVPPSPLLPLRSSLSTPPSPLLPRHVRRGNISVPSSPHLQRSSCAVEAALQRSKTYGSRSSIGAPASVPPSTICLNGKEVGKQHAGDAVEWVAQRTGGIRLSGTVIFNPNANVSSQTDDDGEEDDSPSSGFAHGPGVRAATYCQLNPCVCSTCPSAPPLDQCVLLPEHHIQTSGGLETSWVSPGKAGGTASLQVPAVEVSRRDAHPHGEHISRSGLYPSLAQWSCSGKGEQRGSEGTLGNNVAANTCPRLGAMQDVEHPDIQRSRLNIRSRFHGNQDLVHRLFMCISGVADQLHSNYASELRTVLKTLFEVMATKPVCGEDKEKQRKASSGLCGVALDDCPLCLESMSPTSPRAQGEPCAGLPAWMPDEACVLCTCCKAPFTVIRRKHHCRNCGKIFCSRCSPRSAPLPRYGQLKPVRVCTHCYVFHVTPFCSGHTGI